MSVVTFCRSFLELDRCCSVLANKVNLANKVIVEMNTFRRFSWIVPSDLFVFLFVVLIFPSVPSSFHLFLMVLFPISSEVWDLHRARAWAVRNQATALR